MIHKMNLHDEPFKKIKNGTKTVEMRLNDEKRQLINIGDTIEFKNRITFEIIKVSVIGLVKFKNFDELYNSFDKFVIGYNIEDIANPLDMEKYYSKEEITKYGVLAILIKLI